MAVLREETLAIHSDADVVRVRQMTRELAVALGFRLVDQTKIVTAASELARNTLVHGAGAPRCWRLCTTARAAGCG